GDRVAGDVRAAVAGRSGPRQGDGALLGTTGRGRQVLGRGGRGRRSLCRHADVGELLRQLLAFERQLDPVGVAVDVGDHHFIDAAVVGTGETAVFPQHADVHQGGGVAAVEGEVVEEGGVRENAVDVDAAGILRRAGSLPHADHVAPDAHARRGGEGGGFGAGLVPGAVAAGHEVVELVLAAAVDADQPLVVTLVQD